MENWYDNGIGSEKMKRELTRDAIKDPTPTIGCQKCAKLQAKLKAKDKEIERLNILTEWQRTKSKRLEKVSEYARHKSDCNPKSWENACDCGFLQALKGEK